MAVDKAAWLKKWREMTPAKRMIYAGGSGAVLVVIAGVIFGSPATQTVKADPGRTSSSFSMPINKDLSMEQLAASVESIRKGQDEDRIARERLEKILSAKSDGIKGDPLTSDALRELREIRIELDVVKAQKAIAAPDTLSLDDQLPPDGSASFVQPVGTQQVIEESPKIRVIGGQTKQKDSKDVAIAENTKVLLPAGANFEGVLLNGMDAPTSGATRQNPVPALVRLDTDAILPNRHRYDVRECFAIVSGFGVLSTERAQLQTVTLSCVKADGVVIESKMEGYLVGEDGKVGLRGRLVTKQGQLLAKSFATGFFAGIGQALAPMAVPQLNIAPGATQQFQAPSLSEVATSATAQGLTNTAKSLSAFYLDMAKEMFPIVEIDAMRRVTVVLLKGIELDMIGERK